MLLAAHQRNPLVVSSHHRWTQVSTLSASSCVSPSVHDSKGEAQSGFSVQNAPRRRRLLMPLAAPAARAVDEMRLPLLLLLLPATKDAELCNDESGKYPEVGAAWQRRGGRRRRREPAGALWRLHGDGETRSGRGENRVRSHPPNHSALLSPHTLLLPGHVTPRTGCIIRRRSHRPGGALIPAPDSPPASRISVPARPLGSKRQRS